MSRPKPPPLIIEQVNAAVSISTESFFSQPTQTRDSAYELFLQNQIEINQVANAQSRPITRSLALLGHFSSVEGFFRKLLCDVIVTDHVSRNKCLLQQGISFGAAWAISENATEKQSIPEAMLENTTFTSKRNILEALNTFMCIPEGDVTQEVKSILDSFEKICHLRHCSVHRFGMLGARNAIALDFDSHSGMIGNSMILSQQHIEDIATICSNLVTATNNLAYHVVLGRAKDREQWQGDFLVDRSIFEKYFLLFASTAQAAQAVTHYDRFKVYHGI